MLLEYFQFLRKFDLFADEFVSPDIGFQYGIERKSVVADDLKGCKCPRNMPDVE